jgi:Cu(I)/Ag(I) efflux system membrane fusion protein
MKNYIIYIGILAIGLLLGSLIFGSDSKSEDKHNHETLETKNQLWTCAMHPQIMQLESGNCPICGMNLIPAETSADGLTANQFKMTANALALANIETSIISADLKNIEGLLLSGKIKENEKTNAIQTAHFGGRIEKLFVNTTGEKVFKGQPLALVYSPDLVTAQKELLTAKQTKNSDVTLYNAVRNKLKLWKLSENQINKIESSNTIITNFPIYANVNGVVTIKMVEEGNYVKEGQGLFMIANLNTVWADFDAYEKQISSIKKGDEITITSNANPNKELKAKISFINPILNTSTRTVIVRAKLNNSKGELKPGMFVKGVLTSQKTNKKHILTIPKTAVLWTGKRSVVYVKKQGNEPIFEMREVTLGNEIEINYEILNGLSENEEIVTNGTFTVDAAAQLQGKKSMMNNNGGRVMTGHENHSMDMSQLSTLSFGVRGNCSMCKETIEKAVNSINGVSKANWDVDKKKIEVVFNASKTDEIAIHKIIAASGYDTEKVKGNLDAYNGLPGCCKYDHSMKMDLQQKVGQIMKKE